MRTTRGDVGGARCARRRRASTTGVLCGVVLVAAVALQGMAAVPANAERAEADGEFAVLLLLDASGSMRRVDHGTRLLAGAKDALLRVVKALPADAGVGLRVYGASYGGSNKRVGCRDTELLAPVDTGNRDLLRRQIRSIRAKGETPIGLSLQKAAGDFPSGSEERVVILVSDGEDNCAPPGPQPCDVASQLKSRGVDLRVETIGLGLRRNSDARTELQCVAAVTGGDYYDVPDVRRLAATLDGIAERSLARLTRGEEVNGGVSAPEAPLLKAGTYRDTLRPGETKWYSFRVAEGATPQVLGAVRGLPRIKPSGRNCPAWEMQLVPPHVTNVSYPPYYNRNDFDGSGTSATAVRASDPASESAGGVDFPGQWFVTLSLARTTLNECSQRLPDRGFQVQFEVKLPAGGSGDSETAASPGTSSAEGNRSAAPPAVQKYVVEPEGGTPAWIYPLVAVLVLLLVGGGVGGYLYHRKVNYR